MNIKRSVIESYKVFCPTSTNKCENESEIIYKIERAVSVGKKSSGKAIGNYIVNYHNLEFHLKRSGNQLVVDRMWIMTGSNFKNKYHYVEEQLKQQYDSIHRKVSVIPKKEVKSIN